MMQVRRKGANENLAEWIVDITTEADRQGSDVFIDMYRQCAPPRASLGNFECLARILRWCDFEALPQNALPAVSLYLLDCRGYAPLVGLLQSSSST